MAITFLSALFIPLQYTIFLGAALSLRLYVVASAKTFRLQEAARLDDGGWEMRDASKTLGSNATPVLVVQGLDFFAEVPALDDQMPSACGATNAVVILVLCDMHTITSTAIRWLERYARNLQAGGGALLLADVNAEVLGVLTKSGVPEIFGSDHVFPATPRVLEAEETAWQAAQQWQKTNGTSSVTGDTTQ